jgi:hypothetical protein
MAYSADGATLWVGRTIYERNAIYDVWGEDGAFQCTVRLDMEGHIPAAYRTPPVVVNGLLYHLAASEAGGPVIVVYDVSEPCHDGLPEG